MEKEILDKFESIVTNRDDFLNKWRINTGRKIIGCFPMYVPEELIHAADCLPVTLLGSNEQITKAAGNLPSYIPEY